MSNIASAKSALDAEIKHAQQGLAFYAKRIATLEGMIETLVQLHSAPVTATTPKASAKGKGKVKLVTTVAPEAGTDVVVGKKVRAAKKGATSAKLPATKTEFWKSLLSETPVSNVDLLASAIAALDISPSPADLQKLKQRLANAITGMTKDGSMLAEGTGRARRFFAKAA